MQEMQETPVNTGENGTGRNRTGDPGLMNPCVDASSVQDNTFSSQRTQLGEYATHGNELFGSQGYSKPLPICKTCKTAFVPKRAKESKKHRHTYCSRKCYEDEIRGKPVAANLGTWSPDGTHAEKIRANGLINERLKRIKGFRPLVCSNCANSGRTDAHHTDYTKPDMVAFVCRKCHVKAHRDPAFEITLHPLVVYVPTPSEYYANPGNYPSKPHSPFTPEARGEQSNPVSKGGEA